MMGYLESDARYQSQCSRSDIHQRHQQPFDVDFANLPGSVRTLQYFGFVTLACIATKFSNVRTAMRS
jgi:hypothetical protein